MQDFELPGMLHGRVVRPSGIGAILVSYDQASINHIPGIVKVVRIANFLGVVADSEWSAIRAAQQLKAVWSKWEGLPDEAGLWEHVRSTKLVRDDVTSNIGIRLRRDMPRRTSSRRHMISPSIPMARLVLPVPSQASSTASSPAGLLPRRSMTCASNWQRCSVWRTTMAAAFMSRVPVATAATAMRMPRQMRRSLRGVSASPCACNGCAPMNMVGIPRARQHCWTCAQGSTGTAMLSPGNLNCSFQTAAPLSWISSAPTLLGSTVWAS
jgi:hypothetical protein